MGDIKRVTQFVTTDNRRHAYEDEAKIWQDGLDAQEKFRKFLRDHELSGQRAEEILNFVRSFVNEFALLFRTGHVITDLILKIQAMDEDGAEEDHG